MGRPLLISLLLIASLVESSMAQAPTILTAPYPRAFFFRMTEGYAANPQWDYARWEGAFGRLMGIEGKVLDEEIVGRSLRNIGFFNRFKNEHPDQLVLLHFNGNARQPLYHGDRFFAGHWLYYNGSKLLADLSADENELVIKVDNPELFMTGIGRYKTSNEDLGICRLDKHGRPDWSYSEQVQLISVDSAGRAIRVKRACYNSRPREFRAGRSYVAAHVSEGPWQEGGGLSWTYNHATTCPRDESGKTCDDVLADELAGLFIPGGQLEAFDGLELDSLLYVCLPQRDKLPGREEDCDADGKPDSGIVDGVNVYGIGVVEFCKILRGRLQSRQLLLADGGFLFNQRAFGVINGIESEGWPMMLDYGIQDWSGGLNRMMFWRENSRPPVFNYINHKFKSKGDQPESKHIDLPFSTHRLVQAVAQCTDAGFCYMSSPPAEPDGRPGIWDELIKGSDKQVGWLGRPTGDVIMLATRTPDLLAGKGKALDHGFLANMTGQNVGIDLVGNEICIKAALGGGPLRFSIKAVPVSGKDLYVNLTMRGEGMRGYPPEVARMVWVTLNESMKNGSIGNESKLHRTTRRLAASKPTSRKAMTWVNSKAFTSGFYFSEVKGGQAELAFEIESSEPAWISGISVHAYPDVICREFEHGVVLANPAPHAVEIDLLEVFGNKRFRRIMASAGQDVATNNGKPVGDRVTLAAKDGLFLVRTDTVP